MAGKNPELVITLKADGKELTGTLDVAKMKVRELGDAAAKTGQQSAKSARDISGWEKSAARLGKTLGVAVAGGIAAFSALVIHQASVIEQTRTMSQQFGVSTETLSGWQHAADASNASSQALAGGLKELAQNQAKAAQGQKGYAEAFRTAGIEVTDAAGRLKSMQQMLPELATQFSRMQDGPAKAALAIKIFGERGNELIPFLNNGAKGLADLRTEADQLGLTIDGQTADAVHQLNDNVGRLQDLATGLARNILRDLTPALVNLAGGMGDAKTQGDNMAETAGIISNAFKYVAITVVVAKNAIQATVNVLAATVDTVLGVAGGLRDSAATFVSRSWSATDEFLHGNFRQGIAELRAGATDAKDTLGSAAKDIKNSWSSAGEGVDQAIARTSDGFEEILSKSVKAAGGMQQLATASDRGGAALKDMGDHAGDAARRLKESERQMRENARTMADFARQLEEANLRLSGLSTDQAAYVLKIRALRAEYERWIAAGANAADAQLVLNQRVNDANDAFQTAQNGAADYTKEVTNAGRETDAVAQIVDRSAQSMADAFAGWMTGTLGRGKSFARQMVDLMKQMVAQIIAQWAKMKIFGPMLSSLFGMSGNAYAGGGGGGGFMSSLVGTGMNYASNKAMGSLFSGGGEGAGGGMGNMFSPSKWVQNGKDLWAGFTQPYNGYGSTMFGSFSNAATSNAWGYGGVGYNAGGYGGAMPGIGTSTGASTYTPSTMGYVGAGLTGAYMGYNRWQSSGKDAGGALGAAAYGVGGYYGATAVGAALAGGVTAGLAAIPVVGWIALAAILVDKISGGKLFGTKFKAKELTTRIDLASGTASGTVMKEKQKAFFGGREQRTYDRDVGPEAQQAARTMTDNINRLMQQAAGQIGVDTANALDASLTVASKLSKKGKVKSTEYIVEWMGQTWKEATEEAANQRIGADAILSVLDQAFQTTKTTTTTSGGPQHGGRFARLDRFGDQMGQLDDAIAAAEQVTKTTTTVVGEASEIAKRWQDDAEQLQAGAQFLLSAATDMHNGMSLIGTDGPGSLTSIADLTGELAQQNEDLTQTYQRLQAETKSVRDAISLMHVDLGKTGEEIVRFADDIANAAGGVQNAQQLWQAFFQSYYGQGQLVANALEQQKAQLARMLDATGLAADTTMEQFRKAFEQALPTMNPQDVVQWLQLSQVLATVTQNTAQLADAQRQYNTFIAGVAGQTDPLVDQLMSILDWIGQTTAQANQLAQAAGQQGAAEADLIKIREAGQQKVAQLTASIVADAQQRIGNLWGSEIERLQKLVQSSNESVRIAAGFELKQRQQAQQNAARLGDARALAQDVASMMFIQQNKSAAEVAKELGFSLGDLAGELGLKGNELQAYIDKLVGNATAMADINKSVTAGNETIASLLEDMLAVMQGQPLPPVSSHTAPLPDGSDANQGGTVAVNPDVIAFDRGQTPAQPTTQALQSVAEGIDSLRADLRSGDGVAASKLDRIAQQIETLNRRLLERESPYRSQRLA